MKTSVHAERHKLKERMRTSLAMLSLGLVLLAFLVAIDRPQWFVLRPASGTAAALSAAATSPVADDGTRSPAR